MFKALDLIPGNLRHWKTKLVYNITCDSNATIEPKIKRSVFTLPTDMYVLTVYINQGFPTFS